MPGHKVIVVRHFESIVNNHFFFWVCGRDSTMSGASDDNRGDKDPCPLQYHDFALVDSAKMCPFYSVLLSRSLDEGIAPNELDKLQSDLETLLAAANRRARLLDSETKVLIDWAEKKDKKVAKQRELEILNSLTTFKRSRPGSGDRSAKRQKLDEAKSSHTSSQPVGRPKSKQVGNKDAQIAEEDNGGVKSRSDTPNRFWTTVEPYCADITMEDLKFLEDSMKVADDEQEFYKVPALGRHYSEKWAQEDLLEELNEGNKSQEKVRRGALTPNGNSDKASEVNSLLKKVDAARLHADEDVQCPFGTLTQRLVSALIEQNIIAPVPDQSLSNTRESTTTRSGNTTCRTPTKPPHIPHTRTLEARIREELVFQGLLDADDEKVEDNGDEVLAELKRHQSELRSLTAKNRQAKQELCKLAQDEIRRQELRHKVQIADAEVIETYRKIMACKQKRKSPTKKEKEMAWKALREREAVLRVLGNT